MTPTFISNVDPDAMDATLLFNRITGAYYSVSSDVDGQPQYDRTLFEGRSCKFNFNSDIVVGNLIVNADGTYTDNYKVVPESEQREQVYENTLNMQAEQKITKRYPLVTQVNVVTKAIELLGEKQGVQDSEEFKALSEMVSYINLCIQTNNAKKEFWSKNPDVDYFSDERVAEDQSARLEGGVHESIGPRPITGGRTFRSNGF